MKFYWKNNYATKVILSHFLSLSLSLTYQEILYVSKKVTKVYVEKVPRGGYHDVVIVTISNTL